MHFYSVNHLKDSNGRGHLVHRGFWLSGTPRLILVCRLFGHRPVVDGTRGVRPEDPGHRWVCCDRCGVRPQPQGVLDPDLWDIGEAYDGPMQAPRQLSPTVLKQLASRGHKPAAPTIPGLWPAKPTGVLGGELLIGRPYSSGASLKVGNGGSEQTLAAHAGLRPLGTLYLHTEDHGTWLQRRLNPVGYDSRVIEVTIADKRLSTSLWAKRNERSKSDPWWMHGSLRLDPRDILLGEIHNSWEDVGEAVGGTVHLPDGTVHPVKLTLQKWTAARRKHPLRKTVTWHVNWTSAAGIPFRNHDWKGDNVYGSAVSVSTTAVDTGQWATEACAAIAIDIVRDRTRHDYRPAPATADATS